MKRLALIIALAILPFAAQAKTGLLRYGIEWGFSANFLEGHDYIYQTETEPHYLLPEDRRCGFSYSSNAYILANFGFNLSEKSALGLVTGYAGVYKERAGFPILLRYNLYPATMHKDGHFFLADAGIIIPDNGKGLMGQISIGAGYRYSLSDKINLDITLSIRGIHDNPPIWDLTDQTYVSPQYIRRNDAGYASFNIGVAVNF